jgi:anti-sigma factor ChrR (cupin superfamily)
MHDEKKTTASNQLEEFEDLAAALALGALGDEETKRLSDLLRNLGAKGKITLVELRRVNHALGLTTDGPAEPLAAVKDRIMQSLNDSHAAVPNPEFSFVRKNEGTWESMAPGVAFKSLFNNPVTGSSTMLVRMVAGSTVPTHRHDHLEELYVLEGDCYCAGQRLHAGDYHRAEGGSTHGVTFTERGCLMIVHTSSPAAKS